MRFQIDLDLTTAVPFGAERVPLTYEFELCEREFEVSRNVAHGAGFLLLMTVVLVPIGFLLATMLGDVDTVREYYIGIDEVEWDYAPKGSDLCQGHSFDYAAQLWTSGKSRATVCVFI